MSAYEGMTGRVIDRQRVSILTGYHRLSELAEMADRPEDLPMMIGHVETWARTAQF